MSKFPESPSIAVIGLGYVGLPLAVALARSYAVTGFDINPSRIQELGEGYDRTREISESDLRSSSLHITSDMASLSNCNLFIVTVPTPIDDQNQPDLTALAKASKMVGSVMKKGAIVVYESTVYPGVTEDVCGPILEEVSGMKAGKGFYLGYSPERINPGDKVHTIDKITKVVSGQTPEVTGYLATVYGSINKGNIFRATSIKAAEAAKVIENTQRDINIAFINEIAGIFTKMGLSIHDVLEAAGTKWNFMDFKPGLVGGHCIGVDPYYLAHLSQKLNHPPEVILAGRKTNEEMPTFLAEEVHSHLRKPSKILVLGLTFKEDIPDLRNTKVVKVIQALQSRGHTVDVHDPCAHPHEASDFYDLSLLPTLDDIGLYDCIVGAVSHKGYLSFTEQNFKSLLKPKGLIADIKGMWSHLNLGSAFQYWRL